MTIRRCGVGLRVAAANQLALSQIDIGQVEVEVSGEIRKGAVFERAQQVVWDGGTVQGGVADVGVEFDPPAPGAVQAVSIRHVWFEGKFNRLIRAVGTVGRCYDLPKQWRAYSINVASGIAPAPSGVASS